MESCFADKFFLIWSVEEEGFSVNLLALVQGNRRAADQHLRQLGVWC